MQYDTIQALRMSETPKVGHKGFIVTQIVVLYLIVNPATKPITSPNVFDSYFPSSILDVKLLHLYPYNSRSFIPIFPMNGALNIEAAQPAPSVILPEPLKMSVPDAFWVCCLIITQQNGRRAYRSSVSY